MPTSLILIIKNLRWLHRRVFLHPENEVIMSVNSKQWFGLPL
ncbi:hypothetical protein GRPL_02474, partial [Raoultella planticola ATCC 33531]